MGLVMRMMTEVWMIEVTPNLMLGLNVMRVMFKIEIDLVDSHPRMTILFKSV